MRHVIAERDGYKVWSTPDVAPEDVEFTRCFFSTLEEKQKWQNLWDQKRRIRDEIYNSSARIENIADV